MVMILMIVMIKLIPKNLMTIMQDMMILMMITMILMMNSICNLRRKTSKEILVVFHSELNYKFHFIIKQLAEGFLKATRMSGRKQRKMYNVFGANRKARKWKVHKIQNKIHQHPMIYSQVSVKSD